MLTLEDNIGNQDSYLRNLDASSSFGVATVVTDVDVPDGRAWNATVETLQTMTHAGVTFVNKQNSHVCNYGIRGNVPGDIPSSAL